MALVVLIIPEAVTPDLLFFTRSGVHDNTGPVVQLEARLEEIAPFQRSSFVP